MPNATCELQPELQIMIRRITSYNVCYTKLLRIKYGVRLVDLYNTLGKTTFPSLRKRKSVSQRTLQSMHFRRSHIHITQEAYDFLMDELNKRFSIYGDIML